MICKDANPKFIESLKCSITLVSRDVELYNGEGTLHPNVTLNSLFVSSIQLECFYKTLKSIFAIQLHLVAYTKFGAIYRPLGIDTHIDVCGVYSGVAKHVLMSTTYLDAVDKNLSLGCPVSGTRYVRDLKLFHVFYPDILPLGTWRLDHNVYTKDNGVDEPILTAQLYFVIAHNDTKIF